MQRSQRPNSEVQAALGREPFATATRILAMLIWLTGGDNAERSVTPLARYTRERARRESSTGRRWLQQLAESDFELREVIDVIPDTSLRLGASPEAGRPVTVHEPRLAKHYSLGRPQELDAKTARAYHSIRRLGVAVHGHCLAAIGVLLQGETRADFQVSQPDPFWEKFSDCRHPYFSHTT